MRDFPINLQKLYTVYGSFVGPAVIHIPPFLTQLCVLLVWSINRARESLPEFVVVFCESIKRARPCLASLNALSLVFIVKGVPKFAHVRGWRELRWRDVWGGEGGRRGFTEQKLRSSLYLPCRHIDCQMQQCLLFELSFCLNKYLLEFDCMKYNIET